MRRTVLQSAVAKDRPTRPIGGYAYGYQPGSALSALRETADVRVADPYIHTPALAGRRSASAAWRACGVSAMQDHSRGPGIIEANEQVTFPPLPCDRYPAAGHPLPDLPPHRRLPARHPHRDPDRALSPGPSRNARPRIPVAGHGDRGTTPQRSSPRPVGPGRLYPLGELGDRAR